MGFESFAEFLERKKEGRALTEEQMDEQLELDLKAKAEQEQESKEAEQAKAYDDNETYKALCRKVPTHYREVLNPRVKLWKPEVVDCLAGGKSTLIYGSNGTGKTFLAWYYVTRSWQLGRDALYTTAYDMLRDIKGGYASGTADDRMEKYKKVQILVLDEMDKARMSDDDFALLFSILDHRYSWDRNTVVISNASQAELYEVFGKGLLRRFKDKFEFKE